MFLAPACDRFWRTLCWVNNDTGVVTTEKMWSYLIENDLATNMYQDVSGVTTPDVSVYRR